ncbi:hypothetical protein ACOMHN_000803 [Nucella lapillus]
MFERTVDMQTAAGCKGRGWRRVGAGWPRVVEWSWLKNVDRFVATRNVQTLVALLSDWSHVHSATGSRTALSDMLSGTTSLPTSPVHF